MVLKAKYYSYVAYQEGITMSVPLLTLEARLIRQGRQEAIEALVNTGSSSEEKGTQDVLVNGRNEDFGIPPAILGVSKAE
jgi:hypothetical protein